MRSEAHVDERAHCGKVHQRCVTPAPLQGVGLGAGPERLHLFLDLKHDLAPKGSDRGEKRSESEDKERRFSERYYGRFERVIPLPFAVEEDRPRRRSTAACSP